ncbi:MAG: HAD family hydrolase [Acidimicrobiales bacterium]
MLDPTTIEVVVFDIGGVFLIPHPEPIRAALNSVDLSVDADDGRFHFAHHRGVRAITDSLSDGSEAKEHLAATWSVYDKAYFSALGVPADDLTAAAAARSAQRREGVSAVWRFRLAENIAAFHELSRGSRPLAIVSNNDGSAPTEMVEHGVCQVGEGPLPSVVAVVDSAIIGVSKPDPAIFDPVKTALPDVAPEHMLYVGDTVHADIVGATNAGLQAVQLDPHDLHADFGHNRIADVPALVDVLGT